MNTVRSGFPHSTALIPATMRQKIPAMNRLAATILIPLLVLSMAESAGIAAPIVPLAASFNPVSIDRVKTRIFMPLRNAKVKKRQARVTSWQLEVTSDMPGTYTLERAVNSGALHHLRIQTFENKTYIKADWRYAAPVEVNVRTGGLEIFFYHEKAEPHFRAVAPGVRYWEGQRWSSGGPMRVRVLRLDPDRVRLVPAIASAGVKRMGLSKVSSMARWNGAIAAVNGSFFSPATGQPQGTLVLDGQLVSRSMLNRPSLWLEGDGDAYIKVEKPWASVVLDDGTTLKTHAVNEAARRNRITLYTPQYGQSSRTIADPSRWEFTVNSAGKVVAEGHGNSRIPAGGYVLSGQGNGASTLRKAIGFGQELRLQFAVAPQVTDAIGGGPTLIQNAHVRVLARQQHFRADVARGRAPRTAFGITHDGKYMLVCVDGRLAGYSVGATLTELAWTMKDLGAVEALNLDGGGSTTMWLKGRTINRPSEGGERSVSTALLVIPRGSRVAASLSDLLASVIKY